MILEINATPKSLNQVGSRGGWRAFHHEKKLWQHWIETLLMEQGATRPLPSPVSVRAVLRFPQRRSRDEGNFRALLEKATGDALVNGGWIPSDTPDHFRFFAVEFDPEPGAALTRLYLQEGSI